MADGIKDKLLNSFLLFSWFLIIITIVAKIVLVTVFAFLTEEINFTVKNQFFYNLLSFIIFSINYNL